MILYAQDLLLILSWTAAAYFPVVKSLQENVKKENAAYSAG